MEAILKFNLDEPDDERAHMRCIKSTKLALALLEISSNLKKKSYVLCQREGVDPVDTIYKQIADVLFEYDINLDELLV